MENINDRCPLQSECEQKKCAFINRERECDYYRSNARPGAEIEDQTATVGADVGDFDGEDEQMHEFVMIPTTELHPHPDNPRKDVGDVTELAESIKVNGILQNLTVVPNMVTGEISHETWQRGYTVIIGHRRLAAAKKAGLKELPCIVREMTLQQQVKTMLMENMQRSDLTMHEQAQGFQMMLDMGETVKSIAEDSGFSQTTVRNRLKLMALDQDKVSKAEKRGATLQDYLELDKVEDPEMKNKVLDAIGTANFRDELKRAIETEKMRKIMAAWEADLETFAMKIEKSGYIGETHVPMDYVRNYGRWSPKDTTVEKPEDAGEVRYYFRVSENQIDLYRDHQEREETEEDRQRKAAEEAMDRKIAELREITERHFSLRQDFIMEFGQAKKYLPQIISFATSDIVGTGEWGRDDIDAEILTQLLDLDIDIENCDYPTLREAVSKAALERPEYTLLACAYAAEDGERSSYWEKRWNSDVRAFQIIYDPNDALDGVYALLTSLGYEMSDEEKAMQNGTHELFDDGGRS